MAEINIELQKEENTGENMDTQSPEKIDQEKPEATKKPSPEDIRLVYQELCTSYRAIDEFRTKLLGFLPLATGGLFLLIVNPEEAKQKVIEPFLLPIGIFGFAIALGLFFFELYGIRKCHYLIKVGDYLESQMGGLKGQFVTRPPGILGFISEPLASGIIYPAVLAAWTALARYYPVRQIDYCAAIWVFTLGLLISCLFILWLNCHDQPVLPVTSEERKQGWFCRIVCRIVGKKKV